jgi:hypothetical protein
MRITITIGIEIKTRTRIRIRMQGMREQRQGTEAMYPSGLWRGYWEQPGFGRQFMEDFRLRFQDGVVSGSGRDMVGPFVIRGEYTSGDVAFVKQYLGRHQVVYSGQYDGEGTIYGRWTIVGTGTGPFALSPVRGRENTSGPVEEIRPSE